MVQQFVITAYTYPLGDEHLRHVRVASSNLCPGLLLLYSAETWLDNFCGLSFQQPFRMGNSATSNEPHPFITSNISYLLDVPKPIQWTQIESMLRPCGRVQSQILWTVRKGIFEFRSWTMTFEDEVKGPCPVKALVIHNATWN
jgi:hypothetical protein